MSNSNIYDRDDVIIDPRLNVPIDIIGVRTGIPEEMEDQIDSEFATEAAEDVFDLGYSEYESVSNDESQAEEQDDYKQYPPPNAMTIVSQTVRISPDGTHVVDVVFEVTGGLEGGEYEARIAKV